MFRSTSRRVQTRKLISLSLSLFLYLCLLPVMPGSPSRAKTVAPNGDPQDQIPNAIPVIAPGSAYRQTNLITDSPGLSAGPGSIARQSLGHHVDGKQSLLGCEQWHQHYLS
jgi:hypothetical protein